jgi:hypothetical protein
MFVCVCMIIILLYTTKNTKYEWERYWTDAEAGVIAYATYTIAKKTQMGTWGSPTVFKHLQRLYGNTKPRGLALDLGFGVPRGGQGVYECYGHGTCGGVDSSFKCTCVDGWFGNCNMATCPVSRNICVCMSTSSLLCKVLL